VVGVVRGDLDAEVVEVAALGFLGVEGIVAVEKGWGFLLGVIGVSVLKLMLVVLLGLIGMCDDSLDVSWHNPGHLVFCCFRLWAASGCVC
jgi:hypothetical protein